MKVHEVYMAFQGEGRNLGVYSYFIRTFGCPVQCNWCDIPESWNGKEKPFTVTPEKLSKEIADNARDLVEEKFSWYKIE